ncbi:hypothetical protein P9239_19075 [Caballeronia sp. LZ062]|uniref:hypothetical protein n=1 Tax=unclassified Caballeronia TaxID=2646786 RepID=UPI00285C57D3|nr:MULTISPECIES: hypothetical protein [unclassified Caballeronia]MDR5855759.1 hypothetical protein [Caballeronia sp. LZ050]MDR5872454.1 hypothetical protein [Caballeronia sp. LZ062]
MISKKLMLVLTGLVLANIEACGDKQEAASPPSSSASPVLASKTLSASLPPVGGKDAGRTAQGAVQAQPTVADQDGLIRVRFDEIFSIGPNGDLTPKVPVDINGVQMTPGVTFGGGVQFGGFAVGQALGHDFGVRQLGNGFIQLVKYYN